MSALWCSFGKSVGQNDAWVVRAWTIEDADIAYALYEGAAGLFCELIQDLIALLAIADTRFDLDEFVRPQRDVQFARDRGRRAALADENNGIAAMGQTAEIFLLFFVQLHGDAR